MKLGERIVNILLNWIIFLAAPIWILPVLLGGLVIHPEFRRTMFLGDDALWP